MLHSWSVADVVGWLASQVHRETTIAPECKMCFVARSAALHASIPRQRDHGNGVCLLHIRRQ